MRRILLVAVLMMLPLHAFAAGGGILKRNTGITTVASKYSVSETIDKVEAAAKGVGAHIFNRIDFQDLSKKADVPIKPNQLIIFGRGKGGPYIIKEAPLAAIDLPFKALAWESDDGKVWLSYTNGSYINQRYAVKGANEYVKNIDETVKKIVGEALK